MRTAIADGWRRYSSAFRPMLGLPPRLPASSALLASPAIGAFAPRSRTEVLIPAHLITFRFAEFGGGMGIISPAGELCTLGFAPQSALSRRAVELKFSSPAPFITFRFAEFGGGMGIRTPDLLIANETLYQLSYTPKQL